MAQGYWVTRNGQVVHIPDMTDLHLQNTINYLKRRISVIEDFDPHYTVGSYGDYDDAEVNRMVDDLLKEETLIRLESKLNELVMELKSRR